MKSKCSQCGLCCQLFFVNISEKEYRSGKYKTQFEELGMMNAFSDASTCGANILRQKRNGHCIYLKKTRCSIHATRPQVCREFYCSSKLRKYKHMIKQIEHKQASLGKTKEIISKKVT